MTIASSASPSELVTTDFDVASVLSELSSLVESAPDGWRGHIFRAISRWRLPVEEIAEEEHVYFIAGEAFNWRRLAERLAWHVTLQLPEDVEVKMQRWLEDDHMFGGLEESEFRRLLGHDKWRAYLNYFYGVTLERCLLVHSGHRILKSRFGRGRRPSDDMMDEAYVALYGEDESLLWAEFASGTGRGEDSGAARSVALDDEFTYWLFKRRISSMYQVHVAHEVKHGLEMLGRIESADKRRLKMLRLDDSGQLLEFRLSKRVVNRRRTFAGAN